MGSSLPPAFLSLYPSIGPGHVWPGKSLKKGLKASVHLFHFPNPGGHKIVRLFRSFHEGKRLSYYYFRLTIARIKDYTRTDAVTMDEQEPHSNGLLADKVVYSSRLNFPSFLIFSGRVVMKSIEWMTGDRESKSPVVLCSSTTSFRWRRRHRSFMSIIASTRDFFSRSYSPSLGALSHSDSMLPCSHRGSALLFYSNVSGRESITLWLFAKTATVSFSHFFLFAFPFQFSPSPILLHSHISLGGKCPPTVHWLKFASNANNKETVLERTHELIRAASSDGLFKNVVAMSPSPQPKKKKECIVVMERITLHNNLYGYVLKRSRYAQNTEFHLEIVTICSPLTFIIVIS